MRTAVASTSVDAYVAMFAGPKLGEQQRAILAFLAAHPRMNYTRNELAAALRLRLSAVCGRVHELLALGSVEELPRRPDLITGVAAHPLRLVPIQPDMFA